MIDGVLTVALALLALNMLGSLVRVVLGPGDRDRLTGVVLAGTSGIAFLLLASVRFGEPALRDAALAICALTVVIAVVRIRAEQATDAPADTRTAGAHPRDARGPGARDRTDDGSQPGKWGAGHG